MLLAYQSRGSVAHAVPRCSHDPQRLIASISPAVTTRRDYLEIHSQRKVMRARFCTHLCLKYDICDSTVLPNHQSLDAEDE